MIEWFCVGEQELLNRMDAECIVQSLSLFPIEQACTPSVVYSYIVQICSILSNLLVFLR